MFIIIFHLYVLHALNLHITIQAWSCNKRN
uniref:Uncharacterized protein n=1 Tax=Arundo donax TaxID=35708 RepID=A0A0A9BI26_ARUDO